MIILGCVLFSEVAMEDLDEMVKAPQIIQSRDIRDEISIDEADGCIEITTDVSPAISYALYVNKTHLVKEIRIKNTIDKDIYDLNIRITTDNDLIEPFTKEISILNAGQEISIRRPEVLAHTSVLLAMNEMTESLLKRWKFQRTAAATSPSAITIPCNTSWTRRCMKISRSHSTS